MKRLIILLLVMFSCKEPIIQNKENISEKINEKYRPQFHFSPPYGWMNDPNGMFFYEDTYHLFYQYYPDDNVWGPMHWGHASSKDLINWKNLPIAIYPDGNNYIFSGSAIVDNDNKSGLGNGINPPIIAFYTNHDMFLERKWNGELDSPYINVETQHIAYSKDLGKSWIKYTNNPVIENPGYRDYRDPKVTWLDEYKKWIISLAARDRIIFYSSDNLIDWKYLSEFTGHGEMNGVWECPDLFPLTDNEGNKKWVLLVSINKSSPNGGSGTQYFIGDFDGNNFSIDPDFLMDKKSIWVDYGSDNYAGVTWNNTKKSLNSRKFIGWMSNWKYGEFVPTYNWRSSMTLARDVSLYRTNGSYRLKFKPLGLEKISKLNFSGKIKEIHKIKDNLNRIKISDINSNEFEINFENEKENLSINFSSNYFKIDRSNFLFKPSKVDEKRKLKSESFLNSFIKNQTAYFDRDVKSLDIIIDKSSIEIFINEGELVITDIFFYESDFDVVKIKGIEGSLFEEFSIKPNY